MVKGTLKNREKEDREAEIVEARDLMKKAMRY